MDSIRFGLIIASAGLLLLAMLPVKRLLTDLPKGEMRRAWHLLAVLMLVMMGCEIAYAFGWASVSISRDLMMPIALLAGSWFVMVVSQMSAASIADAHRLRRLEQESVTDQLTGLYNRRFLDRALHVEMERARRQGQPLSLMMIDADHFKRINDEYGHVVGDEVLRHVAATIAEHCRACDIVARYGGEEFAVLVPGGSLAQARWQAERLRRRLATRPLKVEHDGETHRLFARVSIGVGQLSLLDADHAVSLLRRADKALYLAKNNGRNRVEVARVETTRDRVAHLKDWVERKRATRAA